MQILKLSDNSFRKLLRIDRLINKTLSINCPCNYHNKRLLKLEKLKANILLRCIY